MAFRALPERDTLLQLLSYDPETGKLFWCERPVEMFPSRRSAGRWNTLYAGQEAFTGVHLTGYRQGRIDGERYKAHRVIWKMMTGEDPGEIDHINGDRADNSWANLREVERLENSRNRARHYGNTSGVCGVMWHKAGQKWLAKIGVGYAQIHLGVFDTFEEAVAARKAAEAEHGFHENHGRAA